MTTLRNTPPQQNILQRLVYLLWDLERRDVRVFAMCVVAAGILWLFNALNQERVETIDMPIEFLYNQNRYIPVKPLPTQITITVKGSGWQILRKMWGVRVKPVRYSLTNFTNRSLNVLAGKDLRRDIVEALSKDLQLEEILSDNIPIWLDLRTKRVLQVRVDSIQMPLAEGYRITSEISVKPERIAFNGPDIILRELSSPFLVRLNGRNLRDEVSQRVRVVIYDDTLKLVQKDEDAVEISFKTEHYTTKSSRFIPRLLNFPRDTKFYLNTIHRQILVKYSFRTADMGKVRLQDFELGADFMSFNPKDSTVALRLLSKPDVVAETEVEFPNRIKLDYAK